MSLLTRKSEQQNHNEFFYSHGPVWVCPWNSNSQDAEWQRRLRKQLGLGKCYTLIKQSATHHWKEMWIARLVFPLAFTSTDHTVIYPMERDLLWKQPFGVWLQHQRSPNWLSEASLTHYALHCIRAWLLKYMGLEMQPCLFQKTQNILCTALLLLPKCNTIICGISGWCYLPQWSERLFYSK